MVFRFMAATFFLITFFLFSGCSGSKQQVRIDPNMDLTVEFRDAGWGGPGVPKVGWCKDCGGEGRSPALVISGLSSQVTDIVVEFNDLRIPELATDGGHGTLGMSTAGKESVTLPSVREETMKLPRGVRSVKRHRCVFYGHTAGAYKAPCGCGNGNEYSATVKAIARDGDNTTLLAQTTIRLGDF